MVASRVGVDALGDELVSFLQSKGVQTSLIQRDETLPTGSVSVSFNASNQPEYVIHENVAWDHLEFTTELEPLMRQAAAICFGTLAQRCPASRETIHRAISATPQRCLRVYDINLRQDYYDIAWIEKSLQLANVFKLNDEEVDLLAPLFRISTDHPQFSQSLIEKYDLTLVCITRGANGCFIASTDDAVDLPGEPVEVADTVGAGDAFTAGLIFSQLSGSSLENSARFANNIGGLVTSHPGAMPDLADEFTKLKNAKTL